MNILQGKKIILGVTGSIAAYKSAELIRLLKIENAEINVIMTAGANQFITAMTLQTLSENRVSTSLFDVDSEMTMSHITLARSADLILIAPATAHCIAKLAAGFADDLLTTVCLATTAAIAIAPAMNVAMWENIATQDNVRLLKNRNIKFFGPADGIQACGETGEGRMLEPERLLQEIQAMFYQTKRLTGKRIVMTAGPTQESIDPIRYLSNYSSGKMGYAIAEMAALENAEVILISGPTSLPTPANVKKIDVISAKQMLDTVMEYISPCDIFIGTAAVVDYKVVNIHHQKIKKTLPSFQLELERNPDILATVSQIKPRPYLVGFAAETENVIINAKQKLHAKNIDMIVANQVGEGKGFGNDFHEFTVITNNGEEKKFSLRTKKQLAKDLIEIIYANMIARWAERPLELQD